MYCNTHKEYLVPGREEYKIHTLESEDKLHGNVIPDEVQKCESKRKFEVIIVHLKPEK